MKITDLRSGQNRVNVEGTISDVGEVREFDRFGRTIRVATATLKDNSGEINISLWNEDIDKVKKGCKVSVTNGFVKEFQGEPQLTAGKFGKIEVIGKGKVTKEEESVEEPAEESVEEPEEVEKSTEEGEEDESEDEEEGE